jgi:hypothetical protein
MKQLDELVHPYPPELGGLYDLEHLKIMSHVYLLGKYDTDKEAVKKRHSIKR